VSDLGYALILICDENLCVDLDLFASPDDMALAIVHCEKIGLTYS